MTLLLLGLAAAEPCSTPLDDDGLRAIVDRARAAIEDGDVAAHLRASEELEARIPCLVEQLPRRPWADFLVTVSLVKHLDQSPDWNLPLSVALELVPDHPDVPAFLLEEYAPPTTPPGDPVPIPPGTVLVLDGKVLLGEVPPLAGIHVVQTVADGSWRSLLLEHEPLPASFLHTETPERAPTDARPHPASPGWGTAQLTVGAATWSQVPEGDELDQRTERGPKLGASTVGQVVLTGPLGAFWRAGFDLALVKSDASTRRPVPLGDLHTGLSLGRSLGVWLGGGFTVLRLDAPDPTNERPLLLPHYLLGLAGALDGPAAVDFAVGGGYAPGIGGSPFWGSHGFARVGVGPKNARRLRPRLGIEASIVRAALENRSTGSPLGLARSTRLAVDLGVRW